MKTIPDELDQRSRLISLVYEVLREMQAPAEDATEMAVLSALSRAFTDHAIALDLETAAPKAPPKSPPKSPRDMYSRPA
jgi:hypothetical protein